MQAQATNVRIVMCKHPDNVAREGIAASLAGIARIA
jgi:hypothetical protein